MNGNKLTENKDDIQVLKYGVKLLWDLSNAFNTYKMLTKHALRHSNNVSGHWPGFSDMPCHIVTAATSTDRHTINARRFMA